MAQAGNTARRIANVDVESALAEAHERHAARNPESRRRYDAACASFPGGNTRTVLFYAPFPLTVLRGEGQHLFDADGHRYVDFLCEYSAGIFGHSHPAIRAAIDRALDGGIDLGGHNSFEAQLAATLCARFPSLERVRFTNSGTEANLMALSAACAIAGSRKVMVFDGAYHGGVFHFGGGGNRINAPFDFVVARYNEIEGTLALIEEHAGDLAAVLVEPMLGAGGCLPADVRFLQALRDATRAKNIPLIFDEVMTSRLAPGGLQEMHGIIPDVTTLGKYIGGGMSFGAFGGSLDFMQHFDPRRPDAFPHAGTFNNNVLSMSAGLAGMSEVYTPDAARALTARGDALRERLNRLAEEENVAMTFTGIGSMIGVHMRKPPVRTPADAAGGDKRLGELFFFDMLEQGIWMAPRGMILLSLPITDADCDALATAVAEFIDTRRPLLAG